MTNALRIVHYGHACVFVDTGSARLLFDPGTYSTGFEDLRDLDAILITHQHFDHIDVARLPALVSANPGATLVADPATAADDLADLNPTPAHPGDTLSLGGATVQAVGGDHAVIHPEFPVPPNVGYVVDNGALYHPGDSLHVPETEIDILALPSAAPWLSTHDGIEFQRAINPRASFLIHEASLSAIGVESVKGWYTRLAPAHTNVHHLPHATPTTL
ncbi:MBL fold metallo-hydrolase [Actinophytocola sp.]|uniref:MBL fold metallo-hydrolase n=1 Tax=Actinophytocola sp. TaxID=1872138 RepID=UPI002D7FB886|nr:MBL fold metallo-hydrolase [Actinophytocola sp.]HET9140701.1 MBL fold metallo-hydrolase [Actinophytocola sp.]